jgi:hypothetical protein
MALDLLVLRSPDYRDMAHTLWDTEEQAALAARLPGLLVSKSGATVRQPASACAKHSFGLAQVVEVACWAHMTAGVRTGPAANTA